eukprot:329562-Amphidinium_carterae.2
MLALLNLWKILLATEDTHRVEDTVPNSFRLLLGAQRKTGIVRFLKCLPCFCHVGHGDDDGSLSHCFAFRLMKIRPSRHVSRLFVTFGLAFEGKIPQTLPDVLELPAFLTHDLPKLVPGYIDSNSSLSEHLPKSRENFMHPINSLAANKVLNGLVHIRENSALRLWAIYIHANNRSTD